MCLMHGCNTCLSFSVRIYHPPPSVCHIWGYYHVWLLCKRKCFPGGLCKPDWNMHRGSDRNKAYHFSILVLKVIWPNSWAFHKIKSLDWTRSQGSKCPHWRRFEQAPDMQLHLSAFVPVSQLFLWLLKHDPDRILIIKGIFHIMHMHIW